MKKFNGKFAQIGQGMTEYIIIVALIAVAAIGVYSFFGQAIRSQMAGMTNEIAGQNASANQSQAKSAAEGATGQNTKKTMGDYGNAQK